MTWLLLSKRSGVSWLMNLFVVGQSKVAQSKAVESKPRRQTENIFIFLPHTYCEPNPSQHRFEMPLISKEGQFVLKTFLGTIIFDLSTINYPPGENLPPLYSLDSSSYSYSTPPPWGIFCSDETIPSDCTIVFFSGRFRTGPTKSIWQSFKLTTPSAFKNSLKKV